jgi:pseudouridine synthase
MRLQKYMSQAGVASRRKSEELIAAGRVTVDGVVATLGDKADPARQVVAVDGAPVRPAAREYFMLHKPKKYLCTVSDRFGRRTVLDLIPEAPPGTHPVGRLDADVEGLLLLTNDGDFTAAVTHPSRQVEKVYLARVRGVPSPGDLAHLRSGVRLEDGVSAPARARLIEQRDDDDQAIVELGIHEGRKRQVKRMMMAVRHPVLSLKRVRIGPLELGELERGKWRRLTPQEVEACLAAAGARKGR